jgi:hypothetical protein
MKIPDGFTFSGDVYINAIFLTPLIYDTKSFDFCKDGANITPQFYDTITFAIGKLLYHIKHVIILV